MRSANLAPWFHGKRNYELSPVYKFCSAPFRRGEFVLGPAVRASWKSIVDDEWWTTEMVCAFLKIGRKALWERRRNVTLAMPRAYRMAGKRNLYRSAEIREWAAWIAGLPTDNQSAETVTSPSETQGGSSRVNLSSAQVVPQNPRRRTDRSSANADQLSLSF